MNGGRKRVDRKMMTMTSDMIIMISVIMITVIRMMIMTMMVMM